MLIFHLKTNFCQTRAKIRAIWARLLGLGHWAGPCQHWPGTLSLSLLAFLYIKVYLLFFQFQLPTPQPKPPTPISTLSIIIQARMTYQSILPFKTCKFCSVHGVFLFMVQTKHVSDEHLQRSRFTSSAFLVIPTPLSVNDVCFNRWWLSAAGAIVRSLVTYCFLTWIFSVEGLMFMVLMIFPRYSLLKAEFKAVFIIPIQHLRFCCGLFYIRCKGTGLRQWVRND